MYGPALKKHQSVGADWSLLPGYARVEAIKVRLQKMADSLDPAFIDATITAAVKEADAKGVSRMELTPFLLARINELSEGRSLKANIALVRNNAALGARIAVAHAQLRQS